MVLDVFIFLIPTLLSIIVYILFKNKKHTYVLSFSYFIVSFLSIFIISLLNTNMIDNFESKNKIKNILINNTNDTNYDREIYSYLTKTTKNQIVNFKFIQTNKNNKQLAIIHYNEKILNGLILLKNNLYVYY